MNIWRVTGVALMAGLALFLISVLVKLVLVAAATLLLVRVVGGRLASRFYGHRERMGWQSPNIISIDNPVYRVPMNRVSIGRVIPIK